MGPLVLAGWLTAGHAPALLVYLLTCPADKLFLGVVCLAAVAARPA